MSALEENTTKNNNSSTIQDFIKSDAESQLEQLEEEQKLDFNPLQMYFGEDYKVNDFIVIHQPTLQDFIDCGEEHLYAVVAPFTCNTTGYRLKLWEMGIDWNKISNYQLISMLLMGNKFEYSKIIFGDVHFEKFKLVYLSTAKDPEKESFFFDEESGKIITLEEMNKIRQYIQYMFHIFPPEEEFVSGKTLKQDLINRDMQELLQQKKNGTKKSDLLSLISFCLNHPGFKYSKKDLKTIGIVEFMDSVQRLQIYESTHALINGMYSGFVDSSKLKKEDFNFMRSLMANA